MAQYPTPVYPTWGQSFSGAINQGFEGIMQGMQQAQQQKMQNLAFMGQTGYNPQDLLAGQKVGQQLQGMGNPQNQPQQAPIGLPNGQQVQIGQSPLPQSQMDMYQHFQNFLSQGQQKAQAGIADTQSQTNLRNSQATQNNYGTAANARMFGGGGGQQPGMIPSAQQPSQNWTPPSAQSQQSTQSAQQPQSQPASMTQSASLGQGSGGPQVVHDDKTGSDFIVHPTKAGPAYQRVPQNSSELSSERQLAGEWGLSNGKITADQLRSRGVATNFILDGIIHSPEYASYRQSGGDGGMDFNPVQANINAKGKVSGAQAAASTGATLKVNLDSAHSGFTDVMDAAKPIAERMGKGNIAAFNQAVQAGKTQFNDPDSVALNAYLDLASSNYARISKGGTGSISEDDKADAKKVLSSKLNTGGIQAVQDAMETEYGGRVKPLGGGSPAASAQPSPKTQSPKQKQSAGGNANMVAVTAPDGTPGRVPKSKLAAAIKAGYKQAQ